MLLEPPSGGDAINLVVAGERRTFPAASVRSLADLRKSLVEILRFVSAHRSPASKPSAEYAAVNGILATLDPHSLLLTPEEAKEFRTNLASSFSGIRIVFGSGSGMQRTPFRYLATGACA